MRGISRAAAATVSTAVVAGVLEYAMTGGISGWDTAHLRCSCSGRRALGSTTPYATSARGCRAFPQPPRESWMLNSREVNERDQWKKSAILVVGVQYSPKFFKDYFDVIRGAVTRWPHDSRACC